MNDTPEHAVNSAPRPINSCRRCGSYEFTATETYGLQCWIYEDEPHRLNCKSGDGGLNEGSLACARCGAKPNFKFEFV